jgi:hypothetical protein
MDQLLTASPASTPAAVKLFILLTALSFTTAALVCMTAFTRVVIVLSFLRQALGALLTVKREHFALTRALREPMAEQSGHAFLRETMQHFTALLVPPIRRARPLLAHPERRVAVLVAAMEGAISAAVYDSPDWLGEAWFLDELVAMGLGFLERLRD